MTKPKWTGAPPKTNFTPPVYTGKKSENTVNMRRLKETVPRPRSHHADEWEKEMNYWRIKINNFKDGIDLHGKSIKEMQVIYNNLKTGKSWDYSGKKDENDEKINNSIRDAILTL